MLRTDSGKRVPIRIVQRNGIVNCVRDPPMGRITVPCAKDIPAMQRKPGAFDLLLAGCGIYKHMRGPGAVTVLQLVKNISGRPSRKLSENRRRGSYLFWGCPVRHDHPGIGIQYERIVRDCIAGQRVDAGKGTLSNVSIQADGCFNDVLDV